MLQRIYGIPQETLGEGTFGRVGAYSLTGPDKSGRRVAVKEIKEFYNEISFNTMREIYALRQLQGHPNIVKLHDVIIENIRYGYTYIVMEECSKFSLDTVKTLKDCEKYFSQMVDAVTYCHACDILHRDIKIENFLLRGDTIVLCDFSLSTPYHCDRLRHSTDVVSLYYRAPELLRGETNYTSAIDIWSLGIILYCMLVTCLPPRPQRTHDHVRGEDEGHQLQKVLQLPQILSEIFADTPHPLVDLLKRLLVIDPRQRISSMELRQHEVKPLPTFPLRCHQHPLRERTLKWFMNSCQLRDHSLRTWDSTVLLLDRLPDEVFRFTITFLPSEYNFYCVMYICCMISLKIYDGYTVSMLDIFSSFEECYPTFRWPSHKPGFDGLLELELRIYNYLKFDFLTPVVKGINTLLFRQYMMTGEVSYDDLLMKYID